MGYVMEHNSLIQIVILGLLISTVSSGGLKCLMDLQYLKITYLFLPLLIALFISSCLDVQQRSLVHYFSPTSDAIIHIWLKLSSCFTLFSYSDILVVFLHIYVYAGKQC